VQQRDRTDEGDAGDRERRGLEVARDAVEQDGPEDGCAEQRQR